MTKYYRTGCVKVRFKPHPSEKSIIQLTILSNEIASDQSVVVHLCTDPALLKETVDYLISLGMTQSDQYLSEYEPLNIYHILRNYHEPTPAEKVNLEPVFAALGMDLFEIMLMSSTSIRAACKAIKYGFNGTIFYLQSPDIVRFTQNFYTHFIEITESEYQIAALTPEKDDHCRNGKNSGSL